MKEIEKKFGKIIWVEMAYAVVFAILGLIIFLNSEMTNHVVGLLLGTFLLIAGSVEIFAFLDKSRIRLFRPGLGIGIIDLVLGIFIMLNPLETINILNIGLGIWMLVIGIQKFIIFFLLKRAKEEYSKLFLTSAVLLIFMGIIVLMNPFRSLVITKTIGIFIMLSNIINISDLMLLKEEENN